MDENSTAAVTACAPALDNTSAVVAPGVRVIRSSFGAGTCDTAIRVAGRSSDGTLWATDNRNDLWKSTDDLASWQLAWTGPSSYVQVESVLPLVSGRLLILVRDTNGLRHILRSTDATGTAFGTSSLDMPANAHLLSNKSWVESGGAIYVAEYGDPSPPVVLWKSTDDGQSFSVAYSDTRPRHYHAVQVDPYAPGRLWLPAGDKPPQARIGYSTDGGTTFNFITEVAYPRSRAVNLLFAPDAVYWGTDSPNPGGPETPSGAAEVYRWDRDSGRITRLLWGIPGPFYFTAQAGGVYAQFTAVEDAAENGYLDSQSVLILSSTGGAWSVTKTPWMRSQDDPTRNSVITGITEPDAQGRFWASFWNLAGAQYRTSNIEFELDAGAVYPNGLEASFEAEPGPHRAGDAVAFSSFKSTSIALPLSQEWDFGDGTTGSGPSPSHAYSAAGSYVVTLDVRDADGNITETTRALVIDPRPPEPGGAGQPAPKGAVAARVSLLGPRSARIVRGAVMITIRCRGGSRCRGRLTLTAKGRGRAHTVTIGGAAVNVPSGRSSRIRVRINATGRALLRRHRGRLRVLVTFGLLTNGKTSNTSKRIVLVASARR